MPSGNQEPRRNPELKRKARLAVFSWFCTFLGGCRTAYLEIIRDNYGRSEQLESSPLCQHSDNEPEAKRNVPSLFQTTGN